VRALGYDVSVRLDSPAWVDRYKQLAERVTIAACSEYLRSQLIAAGVAGERIVTVPNGVDLGAFPARTRPTDDDRLVVLSVGRLVGKKDPRPTIRALQAVRDCGIDATLTIAGEGGLRRPVEQLVHELNLDEHVTLLGAVDHERVIDLLGQADVVVQHSVRSPGGDEEGMPLSVLEAMASAVPVIGTRHAGIPEAIGDCGYVVESGDIDAIVDAMRKVAEDPDAARELGRRARDRIATGFTWDHERSGLRQLLGLD